jgi:hypothetical protein
MTDEELKSLVASLAEESKETERQFQQLKESMAETSREMDKRSKEIDLTIKKVDRQIDKVAKQMGGINENIGYHAEQFFQNAFEDNKVFGGIEYDDIILNMGYKSKTEKVEFDIVLENGNSVALIEIKNRIHPDFVKKMAEERIDKFRKYFPMYKGYDIYLGIAGFSFSEAVLEEAQKYGVGIIRQVGEGIEIDATGLRAYR